MATIQIRNIPDDEYEAIRAAAKAQGKSLQSYMLDQMKFLARQARKREVLAEVRRMLEADTGTGVTREGIIEDLDAIRGPWPGDERQAS